MATWNDNCAESGSEYCPQSLSNLEDNQPSASNWSFPPTNYEYYDNGTANDANYPLYNNYVPSHHNPNQDQQEDYVGFQQFISQFQQSIDPNMASNDTEIFPSTTIYNTSVPISSNLTPTASEFIPRSASKFINQHDVNFSKSDQTNVGYGYSKEVISADRNRDSCIENTNSSRDWWRQHKPSELKYENLDNAKIFQNDKRSKWKTIKGMAEPVSEMNNHDRGNFRYELRDKNSRYSSRYSGKNAELVDSSSSNYDRRNNGRRREWSSGNTQWDDQKRSNVRDSNVYQNNKQRPDRNYVEDPKPKNYNPEVMRQNKDHNSRDHFKKDKNYKSSHNYQNRNKDSERYDYNNRSNYEIKCLDEDKCNDYNNSIKHPNRDFQNKEAVKAEKDSQGSQRERLTIALDRGTLECLVCCERVKPQQSVWSCLGCYHVLHLACISKWASTSKAENGWRCPACQRICSEIPTRYHCFCQKVDNPRYNRYDSAHSCGQNCGRPGPEPCVHNCTLLCHPGPCPPCQAQVSRKCGCGRTNRIVQCSLLETLLCDAICGKDLNCGQHKCERKCHDGPCMNCEYKIKQECYCGKENKEVLCTIETALLKNFSCEGVCGSILNCGKHKCQMTCHAGECEPCTLDPKLVHTCPCGKKPLAEGCRSSCLDPIPVCGETCGKLLKCGPPSQPHKCSNLCHEGPCPVCPLETLVRCRCGHMDREMQCSLLTTRADDARCQKKCPKKRECGRHKCNAFCCIALEHPCPLPCSHMLSCGLHRCDQNCHRGRCQPCWRSSFEELTCECGASIRHPPVPCGARRPACDRPCSRQHVCNHPIMHTCHSEAECPPCTVLCSKWCHGKHEMRKTIPCHQADFSCGKPCGRALPCGRHSCQLPCHKGPCLRSGQTCTQPCDVARSSCDHACKAPCHDGACPDTPCREMVKVTCQCKHRSTTRACADTTRDYQRIATAMFASKMADMQRGETVNIQDILSNRGSANLKTLDCTDECRLVERNRRMTIGLQIRNPDLSNKLSPRYSEFLKQWAKRDPVFVQNIHDKLTELVRLAKQSKQKFRSHSFPVMNREKRQVVHEMCEQFGVEGEAYDAEPNRNVVATADKEKSWLPSVSLLEVVQRESGQRKVPVPSMGIRTTRNN